VLQNVIFHPTNHLSAIQVTGCNEELQSLLRIDGKLRNSRRRIRVSILIMQVLHHFFQSTPADIRKSNDALLRFSEVALKHGAHCVDLEGYATFQEEFGAFGADEFDVGLVVIVFHRLSLVLIC